MVNRGAMVAQTGGDSRVSARLPDSDRSRRCSAQSTIPALDAPNSGLLAWDAPATTHRIPGGFMNGYRFAERDLGEIALSLVSRALPPSPPKNLQGSVGRARDVRRAAPS